MTEKWEREVRVKNRGGLSVGERARDDCNIGSKRGKAKGEGSEGERRETLTKKYRRRWSRCIAKPRGERD